LRELNPEAMKNLVHLGCDAKIAEEVEAGYDWAMDWEMRIQYGYLGVVEAWHSGLCCQLSTKRMNSRLNEAIETKEPWNKE
jgi:hypothetical protein